MVAHVKYTVQKMPDGQELVFGQKAGVQPGAWELIGDLQEVLQKYEEWKPTTAAERQARWREKKKQKEGSVKVDAPVQKSPPEPTPVLKKPVFVPGLKL